MTQNFIKVHTIFNQLPVRKMEMSRADFYLSKSQNKEDFFWIEYRFLRCEVVIERDKIKLIYNRL